MNVCVGGFLRVCKCPDGSYINKKTGEVIISLEPRNHVGDCRIRKNIQTKDIPIRINDSDYQAVNSSRVSLGEGDY